MRFAGEIWRRGWDSNPRVEVLQTSPLNHLGTAPSDFKYSEIWQRLPQAGSVLGGAT